jgi:hypothetical protein
VPHNRDSVRGGGPRDRGLLDSCSVLDEIDFGLKPGGELKVDTTICHEII